MPGLTSSASPLGAYEFAAVDLETTGFNAGGNDRIVEIGVVTFTVADGIKSRWETLVNPRRDVGATAIHGLTMAELQHAPGFADVRGYLSRLLEGRVLVAHNARFDCGFLEAEFRRSGDVFPDVPVLCTLKLARESALPGRLRLLAQYYGLEDPQPGVHSALVDADAVASVFRNWCLKDGRRVAERGLVALGCALPPAEVRWRHTEAAAAPVPRAEADRRKVAENAYLVSLLTKLPDLSDGRPLPEAEYLDVLDRALEDRYLTADEAEQLMRFAADGGMSRDDALRLNRDYFAALVDAAWADGRMSTAEQADIAAVARLLGLPDQAVAQAVQSPLHKSRRATAVSGESRPAMQGTTVCFTGDLRCSLNGVPITRSQAVILAEERGLSVRDAVTKKLDVLVVADPLSQSGKARKARQYGTRILAEEVFWREVGVDVD